MPKPRTEEQFPLLLVLVGEQDVSQNNQRFFGKGRFDGITSGATAIITEWPSYLSSCWLSALICGVTLFMVSILLTSCMTIQQHPRPPKCSSDFPIAGNKTIHLVHTSHKWYPNQLQLLENITNTFPTYQIHVLIVDSSARYLVKREANKTITNETQIVFLNGTKNDSVLDELVSRHPNIVVTHIDFQDVFKDSPLFLNWVSLNPQMRIFAVRVLQLWQFGGLSYDLLEYKSHVPRKYKNFTNFAEIKLFGYVQNGFKRYERLDPKEVSVDVNGFHMECKTPCHAFFGKVLTKMKRVSEKSTPRDILNGPMFTFCRAGVVDKDFCHVKNIFFQ